MPDRKVIFTAAHAGFAAEGAPLGGGGAVADQLIGEWTRTRPFALDVATPALLARPVSGAEITRFSERRYAEFCFAFDRACTEHVLKHDPAAARVLVNDISEAPDFARLAQAGFDITTIYHVDVVAYVAKIYLRDALDPVFLARAYEWLAPFYPRIAKLVFEKQRQSLRHSRLVVVPSRAMRDLLLACYPATPPGRIRVLPWGQWLEEFDAAEVEQERARLRTEWGLDAAKPTLLMLSRLSPEKGQDLLLEMLAKDEPDWQVIIAGEAAYMRGAAFQAQLHQRAARLRRTKVVFAGHATDLRKRACFALADLYVFPSRHESYGLTLLEALACGVPAVCLDHHGARAVMKPEFGRVAPPAELRAAIEAMLADPERRRKAGHAAREWASRQRFPETAETLARWLKEK